ncbi:hypothetical protein [Tabrizicola sp.]|uniref:hypothetical protein n=1 Tax=Tabrizicola sp. TaxID=2005166 RepID=UPI002737689A|nr:hypothetical protein [Tabrizicola sp.]MDP3197094.1 hypothetical protein [Tabrizicola sp.]
MLVTPSLMHVKTRTGRSQQEDAVLLRPLSGPAAELLDGLTADQVLARVDVPVMRTGPEKTEWQCVRDDHAAMAEAGEWSDLLEALRYTDQERVMASGGRRVAPLISDGMRAGLSRAISRSDWAAAKAELALLEDVYDRNSEDYCAAQVLAQAHVDLANAKRKPTAADLSRDAWTEAAAHYEQAELLVTLFDPIEEMSPLLAVTRYALVPGIEDGGSVCREWYEDWVDLDPEDASVHAAHAVNMLPGWYGSLSAFEREARRAVRLTDGVTGKAAYAIFHIAAAEALGDLSPTLDHEYFFEALADYQSSTGCQVRANVGAHLLSGMAMGFRKAGPTAAWHLTKTRAALSDMLWNRLREIQLDCWDSGNQTLAFAMAEVFGPALKRGARIVRRGDGLGTLVRRT